MKQPKDSYPCAIVPEHLTKLSIEKLAFDKPYFISPGERDDKEPPAIFVDPEGRLRMSKSYAIDMDHDNAEVPFGLVGVMKTFVIDPTAEKVKDAYVADLRFIEAHQLVDTNELTQDIVDQEDYVYWLSEIQNSIQFDAFIGSEHGADIDSGIAPATFYGDPALYEALSRLQKKGDKILKRFTKLEANSKQSGKNREKESEPQDEATQPKLRDRIKRKLFRSLPQN